MSEQGSYYHRQDLDDTRTLNTLSAGPSISKTAERGPRILIVDDERVIQTMIKRSLEMHMNADVIVAENGNVAADWISRSSFDLIISDMQMPIMSGLELYSWIRIHAPQLVDHFFIVSGDLGEDYVADELQRYGVQTLRKPFLIGSLIKIARQHLPIGDEAERIAV